MAGFDRAMVQRMGGAPAAPAATPARPQFTLDLLQKLKQQQGVSGPYQTPPAIQAQLQAVRGQGAQAAASSFGVPPGLVTPAALPRR